METDKYLILIFATLTCVNHEVLSDNAYTSTYFMYDLCDKIIDVYGGPSGPIYSGDIVYHSDGNALKSQCNLTLRNTNTFYPRIGFFFTYISFIGDCCVRVKQGDTYKPDAITGLPDKLCHENKPPLREVFTTDNGQNLLINVANEFAPISDRDFGCYAVFFKLVFNIFSADDHCQGYVCNNSHCISPTINCNDRNPCGDRSDCRENDDVDLTPGEVFGIVAGVVVFITLIMSIVTKHDSKGNNAIFIDLQSITQGHEGQERQQQLQNLTDISFHLNSATGQVGRVQLHIGDNTNPGHQRTDISCQDAPPPYPGGKQGNEVSPNAPPSYEDVVSHTTHCDT